MTIRHWPFAPVGRTARSTLASAAVVVPALVMAVTASGCDPGHGVTFENRTSYTLTVFRGGVQDFLLEPGETATYSIIEFTAPELIEARDETGRLVYSEMVTWEELRERGWEIVISEAVPTGASPTPAAPGGASPSRQ